MDLFKLEFCLELCPGVGFPDHVVILCLVFPGTSILFSTVAEPTYIPTSSVAGKEPQSFLLRLSADWM